MFSDASFAPVKGKTDELFSVLFHRRFARPDLAYSETTAYPANALSATNMAAKLVISTIADVRHTMFMSGLTPFPREHWAVLGPAMRTQARLHEHWPVIGRAGRSNTTGVRRSAGWATTSPSASGWRRRAVRGGRRRPREGCVFLSDFDARELAVRSPRTRAPRVPASAGQRPAGAEAVGETWRNCSPSNAALAPSGRACRM